MKEKSTSNNLENDRLKKNTQENDFNNLITRLKDISKTISLLEKKYLDKF